MVGIEMMGATDGRSWVSLIAIYRALYLHSTCKLCGAATTPVIRLL